MFPACFLEQRTGHPTYYFNQERYRHFYVSLNYFFNSKHKVKNDVIRNDNDIQYRL